MPFSMKSIVMGPFMSQSTVRSSLLTTAAGTFSLLESHKLSFVNFLFAKTCFSIHITYSSINLTWFAIKNFMTGLYSSLKPQNKYFCEIKITFAINHFQIIQSLYLRKIIQGGEKLSCFIPKSSPSLLNEPCILKE